MIKRRFYREEHGDKDEPSSGSSSSSSSESEVEAESEDHSGAVELKQNDDESSSGYESENSSADEIKVDSSGFNNEDDGSGSDKHNPISPQLTDKHVADIFKQDINGAAQKESVPSEMSDFVLKFKSVYKCRICPRIVCLTEETMRTHINSKRHTRSEKLLKENRLKTMLNSDGEMENQETPAEMNARILALAQNKSKKKNKGGRQRQKNRTRKKKAVSSSDKTKESIEEAAKKRRKSEK